MLCITVIIIKKYYFYSEIFAESAKKDSSWLESVLGKSRMGVFHPDFEVNVLNLILLHVEGWCHNSASSYNFSMTYL